MATHKLEITTTDLQEAALTLVVDRENQRSAVEDIPAVVLTNGEYLSQRLGDLITSHAESVGAEEFSALREKFIAADEGIRAQVKDTLR